MIEKKDQLSHFRSDLLRVPVGSESRNGLRFFCFLCHEFPSYALACMIKHVLNSRWRKASGILAANYRNQSDLLKKNIIFCCLINIFEQIQTLDLEISDETCLVHLRHKS